MATLRKDLSYKIEKVNLHQKCFMSSTPRPRKAQGLVQGSLSKGGRISTVDLLTQVACFEENVNKIFNIKMNLSKLVSTRRFVGRFEG
jgi:hypothetical protein